MPLVVSQLEEHLPIIRRCICDYFQHLIERRQEAQQGSARVYGGHGVLTVPKLWEDDLDYKLAALFQPPHIKQFELEFLPILSNQGQRNQLGTCAELCELTIQELLHAFKQ